MNEPGTLMLTDLEEEALRNHDVADVAVVVWRRVTPRMTPSQVVKALSALKRKWAEDAK